jgi:hypothetical protein
MVRRILQTGATAQALGTVAIVEGRDPVPSIAGALLGGYFGGAWGEFGFPETQALMMEKTTEVFIEHRFEGEHETKENCP